MFRVLTAIAFMLIVAGASARAESRGRAKARAWQPQATAPVKDCTRLNARFGYYGNPWCSPAEQQAWDRADARRLR